MAAERRWANRIVGHGEEAPDQLLANPRNWRVHPRQQQDALAGVLGEVGWVQDVIVNRTTGHVVDGHARVSIAISRREPAVPVVYVELTPEEEAKVLATFDPIGAMADTDRDALRSLLTEVRTDHDGLRALFRELAPRREPSFDPDSLELPAIPAPSAALGDLYRLGEHRLLCGDAEDAATVARVLAGVRPTLLATDPPYGVRLDMEWRDRAGYNQMGPAAASYMKRAMDGQGISGDTRADWSGAFALVPSLTVAYVWHATAHLLEVGRGLESIGFELRQQIVWVKTVAAMSRSAYHWQHEPCWYAVRKGAPAGWRGGHEQTTVWESPSPKHIMSGSKEEKLDHPTQKPVLLYERPIENHLAPGEALYEPFAGSGTAIIAAELLGRRCYALELEPRYVDLIVARWERVSGQRAELLERAA